MTLLWTIRHSRDPEPADGEEIFWDSLTSASLITLLAIYVCCSAALLKPPIVLGRTLLLTLLLLLAAIPVGMFIEAWRLTGKHRIP